MKNSKSGNILAVFGLQMVIVLLVAGSWIVNITKFCKSDFEAPFKREAIHGIGLVPAISLVTCWFNIDETVESDTTE
jgi:hypothetical protein